uniref:Uncharacterized protein n=1 Tax=Candidatus Kentrum sp. TUN TaxID=2126343 RepID=A0A451APN1_9GAMM|nr:MAG: hypothetical protein BECKTUN1418F_GA0071002_11762 [Candidatus Kentron sp. TUN]VFK64186.1 MAG: hypothetical protein BECKTUN1418D_GA0071000_12494 [Candidatus Kentron sp. TUN]VFK67996.1 MAG: hypothetical protein BECKTUN1418E_GA0071001_11732 [Candidatus Kentron sp. TUN]
MLALRAKADRGCFFNQTPIFSEFLFFRYLNKKTVIHISERFHIMVCINKAINGYAQEAKKLKGKRLVSMTKIR